jgi:hypothetical protein
MKPRSKKRLAWAKKIVGTTKPMIIYRLFNIEKLARELDVADTEDLDRFLIAWSWCNPEHDILHLMAAAERMGGSLTREQAEAIMDEAEAGRPQRTAVQVGRYLGVTDEIRQRLRLWTIHPVDITARELKARCKRKARAREQQRRRKQGAIPRAEYEAKSLSKTKPWEDEGISRRTWYRRQQSVTSVTQNSPITQDYSPYGTGPCAVLLSNVSSDGLVPNAGTPERGSNDGVCLDRASKARAGKARAGKARAGKARAGKAMASLPQRDFHPLRIPSQSHARGFASRSRLRLGRDLCQGRRVA